MFTQSRGLLRATAVRNSCREVMGSHGWFCIEAKMPLQILRASGSWIFNLVPGFEAVPIVAEIPPNGSLEVRLRVVS